MSSTTQTAASRTPVAYTPTTAVPRAPLALLVATGAIIFIANAGLLVLQLLAGRYLAPFIGSSIETWTAVIGVFLTGIAIGNWVGGRVADRYPSTRTLAVLLIVGGLSCLTPIAGMLLCEKTGLHSAVPLGPRIPLLAALFCLLPATLLSMITPLVIKLAIADVRRAGRVAGVAFALSTLGCLLGNYLTGFWLMAEYRLDTIAVGVTVLLVAVGALQFFAKPSFGSPAAPAPPPSAIEAPPSASSGIDLRGRIGKAYAIVFIASFCGMSLELTGSRVLAPILGVSLYSWTGIIGVMLAGTAAGNYLGGVLADRGPQAALSRLAVLLFGLFLAYRSTSLYSTFFAPAEPSAEEFARWTDHLEAITWPLRFGAFLVGLVVARLILMPFFADLRGEQRRPPAAPGDQLAVSLLAASLFTGGIIVLLAILGPGGQTLVDRILISTFTLFFIPMLLLGTISPQVIRMSISDVGHAGRVAGSIYAWSTAGAIAGTFVTGYFLIGALGTQRVLLLIAIVLVALAFAAGKLWRSGTFLFAASIMTGGAVMGFLVKEEMARKDGDGYDLETKYYAIHTKESDREGRRVATLSLDRLVHSYVDLDDPTFLGYKHEEVQGELLRVARERNLPAGVPTNLLVIGGGGYTFPRWAELLLPDVNVEVVEIDPGVTEIAHRKLGLPRDTKIRTFNMDGRQYVSERAPKGHYQLVVQDAVNDLSVPFHLLTKEYNDAIKSLLTPDGVYLLTFIDEVGTGRLWRAAAHTLKETFPHVYLLAAADTAFFHEGRGVYVLYGSMRPLDLEELQVPRDDEEVERPLVPTELNRLIRARHFARGSVIGGAALQDITPWTRVLKSAKLEEVLDRHDGVSYPKMILTDQYAPVDNLMSSVFRDRERALR